MPFVKNLEHVHEYSNEHSSTALYLFTLVLQMNWKRVVFSEIQNDPDDVTFIFSYIHDFKENSVSLTLIKVLICAAFD